MIGNLDLNADPTSLCGSCSLHQNKGPGAEDRGVLRVPEEAGGGKEGAQVLGFSPGRGDDWRDSLSPEQAQVLHTFTKWLLKRLLGGNLCRQFTFLSV